LKEGVAGKPIRQEKKKKHQSCLSVSAATQKESKKQLDILLKLKVESWTTCLTKVPRAVLGSLLARTPNNTGLSTGY
jgi:hypothetical protein